MTVCFVKVALHTVHGNVNASGLMIQLLQNCPLNPLNPLASLWQLYS